MKSEILNNECTGKSPCLTCWRKDGDKNECIDTCQRLKAYRAGRSWKGEEMGTIMEEAEVGDQAPEVGDQPTCVMCNKPAKVRGLCQVHYDSWRNGSIDHPTLGPFKTSNVSVTKGICLIEDCDEPAVIRGLCRAHYQAFRKGTIEHPIQGKFAVSQLHRKSKTKTDKIKPESQPKATQPGKETSAKSTRRSYPFPDIVSLNFTDYPELKAIVFETASKFLMPINHIIMTLIGEAIATRVKKYKANK